MRTNRWFSVLVLSAMSAMAPAKSNAALSAVGPIDPAHGFPVWYQDSTGLALELCLNLRDLLCPAFPSNVDPRLPVSFPSNFPEEAFWWSGEAQVSVDGGGSVLLVLALEAAFANEAPRAGDRLAFARLRIRGRGLPLGTYRITHPYGVQTFNVNTTAGRQINFTEDTGAATVENFNTALSGPVGPFLIWDPEIPPAAPAGYVGNPNFLHEVVGSPLGTNFLKVERQVAGGEFVTVGFTDLFALSGKVAQIAAPPETPPEAPPEAPPEELPPAN